MPLTHLHTLALAPSRNLLRGQFWRSIWDNESHTTGHGSPSFPPTPDVSWPHNPLPTRCSLYQLPARGLFGDSHTSFPFDIISVWFYDAGQTLSQGPLPLQKKKRGTGSGSGPAKPWGPHSQPHLKWGSEKPTS